MGVQGASTEAELVNKRRRKRQAIFKAQMNELLSRRAFCNRILQSTIIPDGYGELHRQSLRVTRVYTHERTRASLQSINLLD
jgi:hypothetical protein